MTDNPRQRRQISLSATGRSLLPRNFLDKNNSGENMPLPLSETGNHFDLNFKTTITPMLAHLGLKFTKKPHPLPSMMNHSHHYHHRAMLTVIIHSCESKRSATPSCGILSSSFSVVLITWWLRSIGFPFILAALLKISVNSVRIYVHIRQSVMYQIPGSRFLE